MRRAAAYCMTRNCYEQALPSIRSMLINGDPDIIYLIIEDDAFPYDLPKTKAINVSGQTLFREDGANAESIYTYMAMIRVALCKILEEDRVLSLDIDTFVEGDLSRLWELPVDDWYLSAGREPHKTRPGFLAINGGVVLYNLARMRDGMADRLIDTLNKKPCRFVDQDAINECCQGGILEMPPEYNVHPWSVPTDKEPVIVHYAGVRDWSAYPLFKKYAKAEVKA